MGADDRQKQALFSYKEGMAFDLPIAMGILPALELVHPDRLRRFAIVGEFALAKRAKPYVDGLLRWR